MKKWLERLTVLFLFLLPLKFGNLAVMPEAGGFYPEYFGDWLFISWHPHSIAYFGTGLLLLSLIFHGGKLPLRSQMLVILWSVIPVLAVLPGMIRGESSIALGEISLLAGCGSAIWAVALQLNNAPERAKKFAGALLIGGVAAAAYGWYQHLVTLDEMREFVRQQEAMGIPVSEGMRFKLTDPRIYSTLASSNTLASFLLIMMLCGVYFAGEWGKKFNPPQASCRVLLVLFGLLFVSVLYLTGSRSALLCPLAAAVLALLSCPKIRLRWRIAGLAAGILLVAAVIVYAICCGRGVATMGERADYWRTSAVLCREYPLTGAGWGAFFRTHMQIKISDVDESARDPHNVVASFAGQSGIPAGLLMLAVLILPLCLLWKYRFEKSLPGVVFWCGIIFTLHSFIDCDWQVGALIVTMGVLYSCAFSLIPDTELKIPAFIPASAAIIIGMTGVWSSYRYLQGDHALSLLQDKLNPATPEIRQKMSLYQIDDLAAKAGAIRPDSAAIPMAAGDWYLRAGMLDEAEKYYLEALKLDPQRPAAFARLAKIELQRGNEAKAVELHNTAHRIFPKSRFYKPERLYQEP